MSTAAAPSAPPASVLLGSEIYVGDQCNENTASGFTSKGLTIKASFFPDHPPRPSKLYVHCPDAVSVEKPRVLYISGDLILFRVAFDPLPGGRPISSLWQCDCFIYRAGPPDRLFLNLLPRLPIRRVFHDFEVGILPRGHDRYTIAALIAVPRNRDKFELFLYRSEDGTWTSRLLSVVAPQREFPISIPTNASYIFNHFTTNVITLGGEYGTMGWVDLWRGILLCDVLRENPSLRGVPVPLPMKHVTGNNGMGWDLGRARDLRGIAFIKGCLKFVELDLTAIEYTDPPDEETHLPTLKVDDWAISTWSNYKMSDSYDDWHKDDCTAQASSITISNKMSSHSPGLLLLPSHEESKTAAEGAALQNLVISDPFPTMDGDDLVVYLMARVKLRHPKAWFLALNMRNNTLQGVAPFAIQEQPGAKVMYCTSQ